MAGVVYTLRFSLEGNRFSPAEPQYAGTRGDHRAARLVFTDLPSEDKYRLEVLDGGGSYDITELLSAPNGTLTYDIPSRWTAPGTAQIRVVRVASEGEEETFRAYYSPIELFFSDREDGDAAGETLPRWQEIMTRLETSVEGAEASAKEAGNRAYLAAESATMAARLAEESQRSAERAATAAATVKKGDKGDPGESPSEEALDAILAMQNALIGDGEILESHYGMVDISVESVDGTTKNFRLYGREVV